MPVSVEFLFQDTTSVSPVGSVTRYYRLTQGVNKKVVRAHRHGPYPQNQDVEHLTAGGTWSPLATWPAKSAAEIDGLMPMCAKLLNLDGA